MRLHGITKTPFQGPIRCLIYGDKVWWAMVPWRDVEDVYGNAGLHYKQVIPWRLLFIPALGIFFPISTTIVGLQISSIGTVLITGLIMAIVGSATGWWVGQLLERVGNTPVYFFRSSWDSDKRTRLLEPMGYEDLSNMTMTQEDMRNAQHAMNAVEEKAAEQLGRPRSTSKEATEAAKKIVTPFIPCWSARGLYHFSQKLDHRAWFSGGTSGWQKVSYIALGVIALSLASLLVFTILATTSSSEPIPSTASSIPTITAEELQGASNAKR